MNIPAGARHKVHPGYASRRWLPGVNSSRLMFVLAAAALLLVGSGWLSITLGAADLSYTQVWRALRVGDDPTARLIVWDFRLPRILVGVLVGANLAVAGALLQGLMRNPLAAPDVIGISAGAGVGAVLVLLVVPLNISMYQEYVAPLSLLPAAAFVGAAVTAAAIYLLAWRHGVSPVRLALAGIALGTVLRAAIIGVVITWGSSRLQGALVWLAGSLWARGWNELAMLWPWALAGLSSAMLAARPMNVLLLGDGMAKGLGMRPQVARLAVTGLSVLLAASATAVAGLIGFVGLVVPHAARLLVGTDYRALLPASALMGGALLVIADMAGRLIFSPQDFPVGIVTSLVGVPFFVYLLRRERA